MLAVGAFITVTMKTEAIQTGIGRLALRFRHSGSVLIAILMCVFALGGTSYGMWEETLGFFVLLVPLALALNYDRMVAAAIIFLGAGIGRDRLDRQPVRDRRRLGRGRDHDRRRDRPADRDVVRARRRSAIAYVIWYARRIRAHPAKSVVGVSASDAAEAESLISDVPALTGTSEVRARRSSPGRSC